ncbi:MAG: hypothetical protein Q4C61_15465 [Lachnospiraceae bacterium]|nr:hypothetical protein [Lachnospiraceae bacterium]
MTKKQGIRAVLFVFVTLAVLLGINSRMGFPKDGQAVRITRRFEEMYRDEKNTWDGIIVGTSEADRAWSAPAAWEEYGMAVYPMSSDGNPFILNSNIIEEVLKYQDLSFVVVELHGARLESLSTNDIKIHRVTDHLKWSANRSDAIERAVGYVEEWYPEQDFPFVLKAGLYFPIIKYHSRLTQGEIYEGDLNHGKTTMKGVYDARQYYMTRKLPLKPYEETAELLDQQKALLDDLIFCAEKNGLKLVFVKNPSDVPEAEQASMNAMVKYVEEKGYPTLNFNDADILKASGVDGSTDFYDDEHMNAKGSRVYTQYLAGYLKEILDIEDHRGDERYQSWDDAAETYDAFYEGALVKIEKWKKKHGV